MFTVKEIFYTVQGEGAQAGHPAVFCRFSGCNLWSGKEEDRAKATCRFCDTDFRGGKRYTEQELIEAIRTTWGGVASMSDCAVSKVGSHPLCVFTGGEPALQLTESLIMGLIRENMSVAVETNGTIPLPPGAYWRTVSPKAGTILKQTSGNELKLVWPQPDIDTEYLRSLPFKHFYLQPMDGTEGALDATITKVLSDPRWNLSLQTHKMVGLR